MNIRISGQWFFYLVLIALGYSVVVQASGGSEESREAFFAASRSNRIIVKMRADSSSFRKLEARNAFFSLGLTFKRPLASALGDISTYQVPREADLHETLEAVRSLAGVEYAVANELFQLPTANRGKAEADAEAEFGSKQMALVANEQNFFNASMGPIDLDSGFRGLMAAPKPPLQPRPAEVRPPVADPDMHLNYGIRKAHVEEAWQTATGDSSIIVAVVDTGIDYNHEDLAYNMWRNPNPSPELNDIVGYNPYHNDGLPYDDDEVHGHGTHAAGIIGAVYGNGIGTSGINQRVSLMAIKGMTASGFAWTEHLVAGLVYAIDHGAKIISGSWANAKKDNPPIIDVLRYAERKGVLVVVAASNSHNDNDNDATAAYPAGYIMDHLIAVASVDENDRLAHSSNYGLKTVALAAPGVDIYSTFPGNRYRYDRGTSVACPAVSGAAALVWSKYPSLTNIEVKKALMDSVDPVADLKGKTITGGRLNVAKALKAAEALAARKK